ncbi:20S_proteasome alpha subunit 3 [Hexamita inflata]|uniref:Proteasome subunit alpha type n=1 Tax=Hexamita inflata TaxID=28002 RepID=A0AA86QE73_9EUKA|nr:20S proteasome alpha subunit 3 [Hexamita inflata]CAI9925931.1 20S proteasome alpha subunit 3 [Hexamita inflata]CAI9951394.1 20S proteasome alpha subunit 3 [Hexamita inflata]
MSRYDSRTTMFSDEGRLMQVEYAMKAVSQAPPVLGIVAQDGIVIAAQKRIPKLFDQDRSGKICLLDQHLAAAVCGIIADANYLVDEARLLCQEHRLHYNEPIGVERLVTQIADTKQSVTQYGGLRPYGVSFLIAGYDEKKKAYNLFQTDPSGNFSQWTATSIGKSSADINSRLKTFVRNLNAQLTVTDSKKFAVASLTKAVEKLDYNADNIEVVVIRYNEGQVSVEYVENDEVNKLCNEVKDEDDDAFAEHQADEQSADE